MARCAMMIAAGAGATELHYLFDNCMLDPGRRELRRGADLVAVEPQVFDLLEYLIRNRDRVVSRDEVFNSIWDGRFVSESTLSTRIGAARSAIGDSGEKQRLIKTLPRKGFRFIGVVREEQMSASATAALAPQGIDVTLALPDKPSIAVLPFSNLSGDLEHEYFALGMAEEIITALSRCNWLFVIARNSSFTYKGKTVDMREVGHNLGARYVLDGSVRRSGNRVRITGQLVEAVSGQSIWADRFDGETTNVFELQDQITGSVVAAIQPRLHLAEMDRLKRKPPQNFDAYDLLLHAQQLEYEFTEQSLTDALRYLEQALAIDPSYAPALALAAYCYAERRCQGWAQNIEAEAKEGLRLTARALEIGKDNGDVLWMIAYADRWLTNDAQRSRELASRSLMFNPNSPVALTVAGWNELVSANRTRALELFGQAQRLSPLDPKAWYLATGMAFAYYVVGQFEEAASWCRRALVQNPRSGPALRTLAACLAKLGKRGQAAEAVREAIKLEPDVTLKKLRARLMFMNEEYRTKLADGLRLAGMPE